MNPRTPLFPSPRSPYQGPGSVPPPASGYSPYSSFTGTPSIPAAPASYTEPVEVEPIEPQREIVAPRYGNLFSRFAAFLIDGVILGLIGAAMVGISYLLARLLAHYLEFDLAAPLFVIAGRLILVPVFFLVVLAYHVQQETGSHQATLGKRIMGLKIVNLRGARLTKLQSMGRCLGLVFLWAGFWVVLFTEKNQTLHDLIAGAVVVEA